MVNKQYFPIFSTFCLMDAERTVVAVTVYNLAQGKGVIIGDAVAIPDPYYSVFDISHNGKVSTVANPTSISGVP